MRGELIHINFSSDILGHTLIPTIFLASFKYILLVFCTHFSKTTKRLELNNDEI